MEHASSTCSFDWEKKLEVVAAVITSDENKKEKNLGLWYKQKKILADFTS